MIVRPKIRNFICTTAHPVGCRKQVAEQIEQAKSALPMKKSVHNVLIIGCSTGYGLASRIAASITCDAATLGVMFEKPATEVRCGSAGWYNNMAAEALLKAEHPDQQIHTINADAFSQETKDQVIDLATQNYGKFDLVIYSLAAPRRKDPVTGEIWQSVLKPIGEPFEGITLDTDNEVLKSVSIEPATNDEIEQTVKVMGGEDWADWMSQLHAADLLAVGCETVAYHYVGRELTWPIYGQATIGRAKAHLEDTAHAINKQLADIDAKAFIGVLKAVVTQSSSAIPIMPLYIAMLYDVMKEEGSHESPIEQILRFFDEQLLSPDRRVEGGVRMRVDDLEMADSVQNEVARRWQVVTDDSLPELADLRGYREDFLKLFGFACADVDYDQDIDLLTGRAHTRALL
ncbi:enoyl-ACP reductase FabV [Allohahella marinimesophila]|uniref:Enoyl-[acyl-carrier-protein] reductase [NADH] n=1 Tax=Allohahella marinimesophila TaxID=1054972 RepID=A0ABP7NU61_9GAMM